MNVINQQRPNTENLTQYRNGPGMVSGVNAAPGMSNAPPPLPPRASSQSCNYQPYGNGYTSFPGGYGFGNAWNYRNTTLGSYGPYNNYGGYSQIYPNGYLNPGYAGRIGGPSGDVEDRFVQFAEESSRPAFQSIESVVRTFSSIAMMLESTHFAMTSSFRAILSVAENIGKTRNMFREVMSAFALVRFFKWLYRKLTYKIGLDPNDPDTEQIWRKTASEAINGNNSGVSTWPIFIFLSLLIGIPYILNKFMNNVRGTKINGNDDPREWLRYNEPVYSALVLYDFNAINSDELTVKNGQKIWLAPQSLQPKDLQGWSKASDNRGGVGLVPTNYIRIVGQLEKKPNENSDSIDSTSSARNTHSLDKSFSSANTSEVTKESDKKVPEEENIFQ